jgi:hypothetical protein
VSELDIGRTMLLWFWALGLAGIEIEIEGGYGWAERLPTWYRKRARAYRIFGAFMGGRPLTGYHVFAFTIPMLLLHLPFVAGVDWTLAGELGAVATYFVVAVVWDHLWMLAGLAALTAVAVVAAPLYHRWYRHMRRAGADDRDATHTYPPPAPEAAWAGGVPELPPLAGAERERP